MQKKSKPISTIQTKLKTLRENKTKLVELALEYRQANLEWDSSSDGQIWERAISDGIL